MDKFIAQACALLVLFALASCGGGGGDGKSTNTVYKISGKVYTGAPMPGTITVTGSGKTVVGTVDSMGSFVVETTVAGPYKLRAESTDRTLQLYSYSVTDGFVNVNPMTTAILYHAAKVDLPTFFLGERTLTGQELNDAEEQVQKILGKTLLQNGIVPGTSSFFTTPFDANRFGMDAVLDSVRVAVSRRGVVVFPNEGIPIDLNATNLPYLAQADEVKIAGLWSKVGRSVLSWSPAETFEVTKKTIDLLETRDQLHIYRDADGGSVFVLNGIGKSVLKSKFVEAIKVVLLDTLVNHRVITVDEENFLLTLNEATFGAFFLTPYLNIASGTPATNDLELRLVEEFNKTRLGKWFLDPVQAAKDTRPIIRWLGACQLPTRIYEGFLSWFPGYSESDSSCAVPNSPPSVSLVASPNPAHEGQVVLLDGSASTDAEPADLAYGWSLQIVEGSGDIILIDRYRPKAYLFAQSITSDTRIVITLNVTDKGGASVSKSTTLLIAKSSLPAPVVTLTGSPTIISSGSSSTLQWSATNATSCTATGAWTGSKATSGTQVVSPVAGSYAYTLNCTGAGGMTSATANLVVSASPAPPVVTISASPTTVVAGGSSTLQWSATDATGCTAQGAWSGGKATSGTQVVSPVAGNYAYTLSCTGVGGTSSATANLVVSAIPAPPVVMITTSPASIMEGTTSTLQWSSTHATNCTAEGAWAGSKATSGMQVVSPAVGDYAYTLSCIGAGGTTSATANLVVSATATAPAPVVTIAASPASITAGSSSTLQWSSSHATNCTAEGAWSGNKATSGTQVVSPVAGTYAFTLSCTGPGGAAKSSAVLTVGGCSLGQLSADPSCVDAGWPRLKLDEPFSRISGNIYNPMSGIDSAKAKISSGVLQLGGAGQSSSYSLSTDLGRYFGGPKVVLVGRMRVPLGGFVILSLANSGGELGFGVRDCGGEMKPFLYGRGGYAPATRNQGGCPSWLDSSSEKTEFFGVSTTAYGLFKVVVDGSILHVERLDELTQRIDSASLVLGRALSSNTAFYLRVAGLGPAEVDWIKIYSD